MDFIQGGKGQYKIFALGKLLNSLYSLTCV